MPEFLWWMLIDVLVVGLSRLLIPRRQPAHLLLSVLVAVVGSVMGGGTSV